MTTSGTYTFTVTLYDIVEQALRVIRKIGEAEAPTAQDLADCKKWVNMLAKQWQGAGDFSEGVKTWTRRRGHLFLSSTTGVYNLSPSATGWTESYVDTTLSSTAATSATTLSLTSVTGISASDKIGIELSDGSLFWSVIQTVGTTSVTISPALTSSASTGAYVVAYTTAAQTPLLIETVVLRTSDNFDRPVSILKDVKQYDMLPSKSNTDSKGDPSRVFYETQLSGGVLRIDVGAAADVTKHLAITYQESIQDMSDSSENPDYPQEWYLPLVMGLAKLVCPIYGLRWLPEHEANYQQAIGIAHNKEPRYESISFEYGGN